MTNPNEDGNGPYRYQQEPLPKAQPERQEQSSGGVEPSGAVVKAVAIAIGRVCEGDDEWHDDHYRSWLTEARAAIDAYALRSGVNETGPAVTRPTQPVSDGYRLALVEAREALGPVAELLDFAEADGGAHPKSVENVRRAAHALASIDRALSSPPTAMPIRATKATLDALIATRAALVRLRRALDGDELRSLTEEAAALAQANRALSVANAGDGWQLVPKTLTAAMIKAACSIDDGPLRTYQEHWDIMLHAAAGQGEGQ